VDTSEREHQMTNARAGSNDAVCAVSGNQRARRPGVDVLFWLVLLYIMVFYVQPGSRVDLLGKIRFELLLGGALVITLLTTRGKRLVTNERVNKATVCFFVAMSLSFIGALMSHTVSDAMPVFIKLAKFFCIYLMILGTVDSSDKLEKFAWTYVFAMLVVVGEPFLLSLQGKNMYPREDGVIRLFGVGQFAHPNGLGTLAIMNLAFLYYFFRYYRSRLVKVFLLVFALISLRVIMLTASRTAYVGLIVLVGWLWLFSKRKMKFLAITAILVMLLLPFVPEMYMDRFVSLKEVTTVVSTDERVHSSVGARWNLIKTGWKVFLDYPIFGCGMDSFRRVAAREHGVWQPTHNLLMQVLSNTGLVGLAAFSYLIISILGALRGSKRSIVSMGRQSAFISCLTELLQVFLLAQLCTGLMAQHILFSNCWWIVGGLAVVNARVVTETAAELEQPAKSSRETRPVRPRPVRAVWDLVSRSHE